MNILHLKTKFLTVTNKYQNHLIKDGLASMPSISFFVFITVHDKNKKKTKKEIFIPPLLCNANIGAKDPLNNKTCVNRLITNCAKSRGTNTSSYNGKPLSKRHTKRNSENATGK